MLFRSDVTASRRSAIRRDAAGGPVVSGWEDASLATRLRRTLLAAAAALAVVALLGGLATHTALRQLWLPLRAEPRRTRYGHLVVLAISSAVAAASVATALG